MPSTRFLITSGSIVALATLLASCNGGGSTPPISGGVSNNVGTQTIALSKNTNVDWPSYNNDVKSLRFSGLAQLTTSNASQLHIVCSFPVPQPNPAPFLGFNFETGPIVVNGVMYFTTVSDTYAINASTCTQLWHNTYTPTHPGGLANRGAAYSNGMVFRGFVDGNVEALNATTGQVVWNKHLADPPETFTAAPLAWQHAIFIGTSGAENGCQCRILALDQSTGNTLWTYQTVPSDSSSPIANWVDGTGQSPTHPAGGSTWSSYSLDPAAGILYVPTGNPGPDFDDRDRGGSNTLTDSVVALNASTGSLITGYQLLAHDVHDWDTAATPAITAGNGNTQVVAGSKDGYVYAFSVSSGTLNWKTAITTVDASPAAPIPGSAISFCPGTTGGVEWNGPSYNPGTNTVYSNGVDICATQLTEETTFAPYSTAAQCNGLWLGSSPCYSFGTQAASKTGWLTAMNAGNGAVLWQRHMTTPMIAGVTATAGGLLLTGDLNGKVLVLDASTGSQLASISAGNQIEPIGAGVITYAVSGKQYVAAAAGIASPLIWTPSQGTGPSSIVVIGL